MYATRPCAKTTTLAAISSKPSTTWLDTRTTADHGSDASTPTNECFSAMSRPFNGSSSNTNEGLFTNAAAIPTRCRVPYDICDQRTSVTCVALAVAKASSTRAPLSRRGTRRNHAT